MSKLIAILLFLWLIPSASGAPALTSSLCLIKGTIATISERVEPYTPESWRISWGLPESRTYIDIKFKKIESTSPGPDCKVQELKKKTFQLRNLEDQKSLSVDDCIKAETQFSGDEFAMGQWVWNIRKCKEHKE